jgi:DNA-directed RNA polymerase alpha subunit
MEFHGGPDKRKRRKPEAPDWLRFMSDDEKEAERIRHWMSVSLADTGLPVRIVNTLEDHGIMNVGDLTKKSIDDLHKIQNLGEITIVKCKNLLNDLRLPSNLI